MVNHLDAEAVFRALADSTRRGILALLRSRELSVQDIAEEFPVSRPAVSKHLRILKEAELVEERREGRQRIYRLHSGPLAAVGAWLAPFGGGERPATAAPPGARPAAAQPVPRPAAVKPAPRRDDWRVW